MLENLVEELLGTLPGLAGVLSPRQRILMDKEPTSDKRHSVNFRNCSGNAERESGTW